MNQKLLGKWAKRAVWLALAVVLSIGCNPLATVGFIFGDDPVKPAEYPLEYKDGPKKGKEVVVAVFVTSAPGIGPVFAGSEGKLASDIAKKLPEIAKAGKKKLVVLDPSLVNTFKMKNQTWKQMHPSEWGKKLGADFVLDIQLDRMSLYQPGSLNKLYEGQADVTVDVYDVDTGPGEAKYEYILPYKYPRGLRAIDAESTPPNRFKMEFLEHLATEICNKHVEHKLSTGIAADE
jgi:hypothetical protein